jgi:hypothetical protein
MRTLSCLALAVLLLPACALLEPADTGAPAPQAATPAPAAQEAPAALPAPFDAVETTQRLNVLLNDTVPGAPAWTALQAEILRRTENAALPGDLRLAVNQLAAFAPPDLAARWREQQAALDADATLYAAHLPVDTDAVNGARVVRRLGPALYLIRLPGGDTAFFNSARRLKNGARLKGVPAMERPRTKPDRAKGDLVDELEEQARSFVELSRADLARIREERAPVETRLREQDSRRGRLERELRAELARLDGLTGSVNAVLAPRLLPRADAPAPAALIRKVGRMARTWSREQYYRYAVPVTGRPAVDAVLKEYLEERRAEVQELLRSTGVGAGRMRANVDAITFKAFTAAPRVLSLRFEEQRDTGGAHPNQAYASFAFDLAAQKQLGLADIFGDLPAALSVLSELAARRMDLVLGGAPFPEGYAPKLENFAVFVLDNGELVFTFPPYQVASYAQGPQELRAPLSHPRLLPLLRPEFAELLRAAAPDETLKAPAKAVKARHKARAHRSRR